MLESFISTVLVIYNMESLSLGLNLDNKWIIESVHGKIIRVELVIAPVQSHPYFLKM